jgi:small-conductance mechanosensitive channel
MRFGPVWPLQTPTPTPTETATEVATDIGGLLPFDIPMWVVNIGESLIVIGLAIVVSRLLVRLLGRRVAQQFRRPSLTRTALRGIRASVYIFALLTILNIYGLRLTDIGLSVAIFSAVVGVVLAPILGSLISGMFLLADQPYEIGDMIELVDTGQRGFVEDITLRHTKIFTLENTFLVIPNGEIRQRDVVNYSAEDSRTRLSLDVLVTYESDIAVARSLIEAAAREVDNVIAGGPDIRVGAARYPASPTVYINNFADHGVLLTLRYWVTEPYKLLAARSKVQTNVWRRLEDANVEIAYPHSHLYFDDTSGEMNVSLNNGLGGLDGVDRPHTATGDSPVPPRQDPDDLADE